MNHTYILLTLLSLLVTLIACAPQVSPVTSDSEELPDQYELRITHNTNDLPNVLMDGNRLRIISVSSSPTDKAITLKYLLLDAAYFNQALNLRVTAPFTPVNSDYPIGFFYERSLRLHIDGRTINLSRDKSEISVQDTPDGPVEYAFYSITPNILRQMAEANELKVQLLGGKDGTHRDIMARFTERNMARLREFQEVYRQ